jgi:hypothetical protein
MCTKNGEDPSTHSEHNSDLWLEVEATGGPDKNQDYNISMTTT